MADTYYPIQKGNFWKYNLKTGGSFTNEITECGADYYIATCSTGNQTSKVKLENGTHFSDSFEAGNFQPTFIDNSKVGDTWEIKYEANGIDSILKMNVIEIAASKEIEGKVFNDVMLIEGESVFSMNGNIIPSGMKTQYYYAKNIGAVLTTSSLGDYMPIVEYQIN